MFNQKNKGDFVRHNFRIYPNATTRAYLAQDGGNQRFFWNRVHEENTKRYNETGKFMWGVEAVTTFLNRMKKEHPFLKLGNAQALQQTGLYYDKSLKKCIRGKNKKGRRAGFPKEKKKRNGISVTYPQSCKIENGKLYIPKNKYGIRVKWDSRGIPKKFTSVTITQLPCGEWHVSFVVPFEKPELVELNENSSVIAIDLNSQFIAVTDNGDAIKNPKHVKRLQKRKARYQRQMARRYKKPTGEKVVVKNIDGTTYETHKGQSNRYRKARKKYAKISHKIANQRKNFIEQVTSDIIESNDVIIVEDLNVKAMQQWNGAMIESAPFGMFRRILTWKANKSGKHLVVINRFQPTSKVCSACGQIHKMPPKKRQMICDCGLVLHRDHNAAINIRTAGLKILNQMIKDTAGTAGINAWGDTNLQLTGRVGTRLDWVSLKQETAWSSDKQ